MRKKRVVFVLFFLFSIFSISQLFSAEDFSVETEIQKITYYAEEYETGNIGYVELLIYLSGVRGKINEALGVVNSEHGGILKEDQIRNVFGEPTEETKWVWVENENREINRGDYVPVWRKLIFDGNKIQIWMNAHPFIFSKGGENILVYNINSEIWFKNKEQKNDFSEGISKIQDLAKEFNANPSTANAEALAEQSVNVEMLFNEYFRQNQAQCIDLVRNIFGSENQRATQKIISQEINFFSSENVEVIAKLEMCDECEWNWINLDLWTERRGNFFSVEENEEKVTGDIISKLTGFQVDEIEEKTDIKEEFGGRQKVEYVNPEVFKNEIRNLIREIKSALERGDYDSVEQIKPKLREINEQWNRQANDVWAEVETEYKNTNNMQEGQNDPYFWIKERQARESRAKEIRLNNYAERKQFYSELFSGYEKREFYFEQIDFEKRLIEEFKESGKEICDNNNDDNGNGQTDCEEDQCGGKFCGRAEMEITENNETKKEVRDLYCIQSKCQIKEEIISEVNEIFCGNHICDGNETLESCAEDCAVCPVFEPIECFEGKVIFSGKDESGCNLEPVCVEEKSCMKDEDCSFLCGIGACIINEGEENGRCEITELKECENPNCADGDERLIGCSSGEKIVGAICSNGIWEETGIECSGEISDEEKTCINECKFEKNVASNECAGYMDVSGAYPDCACNWICEEEPKVQVGGCNVQSDCGGENDVCSNGMCVSIPEVVEEEIIRQQESEEDLSNIAKEQTELPQEEQKENEVIPEEVSQETTETIEETSGPEAVQESSGEIPTGGFIFTFFRALAGKITGLASDEVITESVSEPVSEAPSQPEPVSEPIQGEIPPVQSKPIPEGGVQEQGNIPQEREQNYEDWEERNEDEEERREEQKRENQNRCENDCQRICENKFVVKCVENCMFDEKTGKETGESLEQCQQKCNNEYESEIKNCISDCSSKCLKGGEDWWKEFEERPEDNERKEEKGVFVAGGGCRKASGKTEGFLYFNGWGIPFERLEKLKFKYYEKGNDWCGRELENLLQQRKEFEKGFNQEFVVWFFEDYMANNAENWEQHISGIFELYWKDVEMSRRISEMTKCVGKTEIPLSDLINVKYETEYGKLEFWEEVKSVKIDNGEKVDIVSPYMKIWIFPPKEFITFEMKEAMKNHEFPGSSEEKIERKKDDGPTEEEKAMIRQDEDFMNEIKVIAENYGGSLDSAIQFVDYQTGEIVFNLYVNVNENDIIKMSPMLPEEMPETDVQIKVDFEKIYGMILASEKDMQGERLESPPWDKKFQPVQKINEIVEGVKMWFKMRDIINSAEISPEDAENDVKDMFKTFFNMMMQGDRAPPEEERPLEKDVFEKGKSGQN